MTKRGTRELSTADLVLLSLLAERAMHGYEANAELQRRKVGDWAGLSRPQIYYSLAKLVELGLVKAVREKKTSEGPDRQVYTANARGIEALRRALEREEWCVQRERPAFLAWMALSWQASGKTFRQQMERRRKFLKHEIAREKSTLRDILKEVGHRHHEAVWMVQLIISGFENELKWLARVGREVKKRAPAIKAY
jgi:DNA-binding PadR family transcriptional regulator